MPLDPLLSELVVATLGLKRFLETKELKPLTKGQREQIKTARGTIQNLMRKFYVRADLAPAAPLDDFDFHKVVDLIAAPETQGRAEGNMKAFNDPDLGIAVAETTARIASYLRDRLPRSTRQTLMGSQKIKPSDADLGRFRRIWDVANDPLIVLRDMNEGCLSRDQVRALADLYPALYALMMEVALEVYTEIAARRSEGWSLPSTKERQLAVLRQANVSGSIGPAIQSLYSKGDGPQKSAPPRRSGSLRVDASSESSAGQKAAG